MAIYTTNTKLVNKVTTTTTGAGIVIGDRLIKSIQFIRTGGSAGMVHCTVQISNDNGDHWVNYKRLISNVAAGTVISQVNLDTANNNSSFVFIPLGDEFQVIRTTVNYDNGDGQITAIIQGR